ncbi:TonB-dependent receptor [Pedobacter sp. AW31-3R]|uniref:TonB-dependent receptor n=1 Tax=Pedobacter sp. AW31-3R TaxID=3445781 RepID=UPI003FA0FCFC
MKKYILGAIFMMMLLISSNEVNAQTGSVKGVITNSDGSPVTGATISAGAISTSSNTQGAFTLSNVKPGVQTIRVSHQGFKTYTTKLTVKAGTTENLSISLVSQDNELGEVVISTQKRRQTSIEVPIAVSALSGTALQKLNITEFDALAQYIPGLQMQLQSPNNPGFVIRGITSDDGDSRTQPRVSIFQDGVSISRSRGAVVELFDMERIEVVKGPQGTLFGRGAQIGAVNLIQNKPTDEVKGEINLGYGNYNQKIANGFINTPIVKGKLLNRFSLAYNERDGFIKNLSGGRLNGKNTIAFRDIIRYTPGKNTTADLILNYQHDDYPGTSFKSKTYAPAGGDTDPNSFADLEQGENLYIKRDVFGPTLLVNHTFSDNLSLSSTTAYRHFKANESFDADGTAAPVLWLSEISTGDQVSQELRLNYTGNKFSGFVGGNYFYEDGSQRVPLRTDERSLYVAAVQPQLYSQFSALLGNFPTIPDAMKQGLLNLFAPQPLLVNGRPTLVDKLPDLSALSALPLPAQYAQLVALLSNAPLNPRHEEESTNYGKTSAAEIFADGTYKVTPQFSLTAGIRGTYEKLTGAYRSDPAAGNSVVGMLLTGSPNILSTISNGKIAAAKDYFSYVGRFAANYMFERNNIYATVSRGRRPGVIDITPEETRFLKPEVVWSYEGGIKGSVVEGKLNYDFTAYYYDWDNFQTSTWELTETGALRSVPDDAGKAHSFGLETSLRYSFLKEMSVFTNYGFIDAQFNDRDSEGVEQEYAGNTFRLTPKHTFSVGLDLNFSTGKTTAVFFRPSYSYKSKVYFEDTNREDLSQPGFGIVNSTLGYRIDGKNKYEIAVFGKNIFDKKYIIDAGNSGDAIGLPTFIGGQRVLYGVMLKFGF